MWLVAFQVFTHRKIDILSQQGKPHAADSILSIINLNTKLTSELKTLGQQNSLEEYAKGVAQVAANVVATARELEIFKFAILHEHAARRAVVPKITCLVDAMRGKCYLGVAASLLLALQRAYRVNDSEAFGEKFFATASQAISTTERASYNSDQSNKGQQNNNSGYNNKKKSRNNDTRPEQNQNNRDSSRCPNNASGKNRNGQERRKTPHQEGGRSEKKLSPTQEIVKMAREKSQVDLLKFIACPFMDSCKKNSDGGCWLSHNKTENGMFKVATGSTFENLKTWASKKTKAKAAKEAKQQASGEAQ